MRDKYGRFLPGHRSSPKTEFKKGRINIISEETRRKIGLGNKGKKHTEETKRKMSLSKLGTHVSLEVRKHLSEINSGSRHPQYGKKKSPETLLKMSMARRGNKSVFWKGGISEGYIKKIASRGWNDIRKKVYERDRWTCQICNKHCHNDIQCHHIVPYRVSLNDREDNLITLCRSCHRIEESKYYKKLNGQVELNFI